jgi:2-haloalkanoic acid dehalogenase type II
LRIKAVTLDAYGTLLRNEDLMLIPRRIVADHRLSVGVEQVWRLWADLYCEATQRSPFRTLRDIEDDILRRVLREVGLDADPTPYVDLFFEVTTKVRLYPEVPEALTALGHLPSGIVSNADGEHLAAWPSPLPVRFVLISETVQAYKPDRVVFERALDLLGLPSHEVLHVGDSEVDDVRGARAAGLNVVWVNRDGRSRRADVPPPDFEISDLAGLPDLVARVAA